MTRLGLHASALTANFKPAEADQLLPQLKTHGVSLIELPITDPRSFDASAIGRAVERNGLSVICSLMMPAELDVLRQTSDAMGFLDIVLQAAREAGSDALTGMIYGTIGQFSGTAPTAAEQEAICRLIDHGAKTARRLNMRLGLLPLNRYETHLLNTARQTVQIIERVSAPNTFIHLNTCHMSLEEQGLARGFEEAADHLGYVHLAETNRGVPGQGSLDWQATFKSLKDIGYQGDMTLESPVHSITQGQALWRPVAERPDDVITQGLPFIIEQAAKQGLNFDRP